MANQAPVPASDAGHSDQSHALFKQRHEEELRRNYLQGRHAGRLLSEAETTGTAAKAYTTIS